MPVDEGGVRIIGLREFHKSLKELSDDNTWTKQLREANKAAAEIIAVRARTLAPVRTGKLRSSIRSLASQKSASVAGGGARVPYFGWIDFGGIIRFKKKRGGIKRPFFTKGRIIYVALADRSQEAVNEYAEAVSDLIKRSGLNEG